MQSDLEQVVSVVDWENLNVAQPVQCENLIAQKEGQVYWLINRAEGASCLALKEHILNVRSSRVDKGVEFIKGA